MGNLISPQEFFEEMTKRPDINEIMTRLAESGWDDPAAYLDTPYATGTGEDSGGPQQQQPAEGERN